MLFQWLQINHQEKNNWKCEAFKSFRFQMDLSQNVSISYFTIVFMYAPIAFSVSLLNSIWSEAKQLSSLDFFHSSLKYLILRYSWRIYSPASHAWQQVLSLSEVETFVFGITMENINFILLRGTRFGEIYFYMHIFQISKFMYFHIVYGVCIFISKLRFPGNDSSVQLIFNQEK